MLRLELRTYDKRENISLGTHKSIWVADMSTVLNSRGLVRFKDMAN